jgi:hypothetical protein
MSEIFHVFVEIERPKGKFEGRVVEGCYKIENGEVILTDRHGNAVRDDTGKEYRKKLDPAGNIAVQAKEGAAIMTKQLRKSLRGPNAPPRGFSAPIQYPKSWKVV